MVKAFGYLRYSKKYDKQSNSLESQEEYLDEVSTRDGDDIVCYFSDESTGKNFNRKGWQQMKSELNNYPDVELIYVKKIDRIGRNLVGWELERKEFDKQNVKFKSCIENIIVSGDFMPKLFMLLSEKESHDIGARVMIGQRKSFEKGKYIVRTPLGFRKKIIMNKEGKVINRKVVPIEKEVCFIQDVFNQYEKSGELYSVWKNVKEQGVKLLKQKNKREKRKYNTVFSFTYFQRILKNTLYISYLRKKDKQKGTLYFKLNYLKPIISQDLFFKINPLLKQEIELNLHNI